MNEERWLRFPIALLAFKPESPVATLDAIIDYCLWTVGGSPKAQEITDKEADKFARERSILSSKFADHRRLIRGAQILGITGGNCESMVAVVSSVNAYLSKAGSAAKNQANVSNELFWRAVDTARGNGDRLELSWRDFRFLCALLSKVGSRKFDRCGWQEIQARAAGWCGKADKRAATLAELARRAPLILTEDQIRKTRDELEANKFFCRFKYRTGGKGNGGESWYSFSTSDRAELLGWITDKKHRMKVGIAEKRSQDAALLASHKPTPK
jgi:hypothetical protein